MCDNKFWKRLNIKETPDLHGVVILATRSDGLIINKVIRFPDKLSYSTATEITYKALFELESYRNCSCNEVCCDLHMRLDKITNLNEDNKSNKREEVPS